MQNVHVYNLDKNTHTRTSAFVYSQTVSEALQELGFSG